MVLEPKSAAVERVWSRFPDGARDVLERELSPTDLQTLLLDLARTRARRATPSQTLRRWQSDRFVRPARVDPGQHSELQARLWELLRDTEFEGLELSPLTPMGSCAAVAGVDQNRVVTTVRSSEVVSDPTNVLALEAGRRRRVSREPVHLAACHRVVRAQQFSDPDARSHFALFALLSSRRDAGSATTEAALLITQLLFWQSVLAELLGPVWGHFAYTVIDSDPMRKRFADTVLPALAALPLAEDAERTQGIGYYRTAAFKIMIRTGGGEYEIGDGGFTNWTAELIPDAKERCLISCLSTERLLRALPG